MAAEQRAARRRDRRRADAARRATTLAAGAPRRRRPRGAGGTAAGAARCARSRAPRRATAAAAGAAATSGLRAPARASSAASRRVSASGRSRPHAHRRAGGECEPRRVLRAVVADSALLPSRYLRRRDLKRSRPARQPHRVTRPHARSSWRGQVALPPGSSQRPRAGEPTGLSPIRRQRADRRRSRCGSPQRVRVDRPGGSPQRRTSAATTHRQLVAVPASGPSLYSSTIRSTPASVAVHRAPVQVMLLLRASSRQAVPFRTGIDAACHRAAPRHVKRTLRSSCDWPVRRGHPRPRTCPVGADPSTTVTLATSVVLARARQGEHVRADRDRVLCRHRGRRRVDRRRGPLAVPTLALPLAMPLTAHAPNRAPPLPCRCRRRGIRASTAAWPRCFAALDHPQATASC